MSYVSSRSSLTRRAFLQSLAGAGVFVFGAARYPALGQGRTQDVLTGTRFDLEIGEVPVNFTGKSRIGTVVNGQVPAPLLRWREGDTVTLRVRNRLREASSIHWHGMIVPADMDGVPGLSFEGIPSGGEYVYRFKVNQSGTYWYHAHSRFQEQTGLYGPIVIEPRGGERHRVDRDYVVLLSDWTDLDPERIFATLKKESAYYNFHQRTLGDLVEDIRKHGWRETLEERQMWGRMRMNPTDLLDVSGYAYTYLMNGMTPAGNWTGVFQRGDRVRLRFINGSAMSIFDVRIPGLKLTVIATDGQDVEPVTVDEFRIATAETYDVIVEPQEDRAYTIFAQSMDRTGYARGTLAPRIGMTAEIPPLDPRPILTMNDMGMSHSSSSHDAHAGHSAHSVTTATLRHSVAEFGPNVDMLIEQPSTSLSDPGVGLRDNGRRVLTYADLRTIGGPIDRREPGRTIELHLTGHMERFVWSFDGRKFSEAEPLRFNYGERLRVTLVNDTMMTHPIHLHGMWSEVENERGEFQVRKHTIMVRPTQKISYAVTADALGRWAFHCHLLYHMEAGMFRIVEVAPAGAHAGGHE
ncbi:MAG TPA: copper resistance system multicopper oxidase [Steroidobacteraceae bacterium]